MLVCGTTGCGKSTTIAAMIEEINRARTSHIVTLEDPIEYRFTSKKSFVEQRELGVHISSFEQGLLDVLREDADIIVVGELRDSETMRLTLNAAESGHLVIGTMHATNSEDALHRICNSFPPEAHHIVFSQLPSTMSLLVVQQLVFLEKVGFRVPYLSIMLGTQAIKGLIRENKLSQIESAIQTGKDVGMFTMEQYRRDFIDQKKDFTPPWKNFRPSEEATSEIIYRSPLLDPLKVPEDPRPEPVKTDKKPEMKEPEQRGTRGKHYVIREDRPLDEVLAEITKSDRSTG
jgi:pilus retraction protein PilT